MWHIGTQHPSMMDFYDGNGELQFGVSKDLFNEIVNGLNAMGYDTSYDLNDDSSMKRFQALFTSPAAEMIQANNSQKKWGNYKTIVQNSAGV